MSEGGTKARKISIIYECMLGQHTKAAERALIDGNACARRLEASIDALVPVVGTSDDALAISEVLCLAPGLCDHGNILPVDNGGLERIKRKAANEALDQRVDVDELRRRARDRSKTQRLIVPLFMP